MFLFPNIKITEKKLFGILKKNTQKKSKSYIHVNKGLIYIPCRLMLHPPQFEVKWLFYVLS